MTTAPITITTTPRRVTSVPVSPLTILMLINREAGVTPAVNTIAAVDDTDPSAVLGAAGNEGRKVVRANRGPVQRQHLRAALRREPTPRSTARPR